MRKKQQFSRRKACRYCSDKGLAVDYKEIKMLRHFISEQGKIIPRRIFGTCAKHQRQVTDAIKKARQIALLPYAGHPHF